MVDAMTTDNKTIVVEGKNTVVSSTPFEAEVVADDGSVRTQKMTVKVIEVKGQPRQQKQATNGKDKRGRSQVLQRDENGNVITSNIKPTETEDKYTHEQVITPPFNLLSLIVLEEESNILRECVDAMVNNIAGFGYTYRPRKIREKEKEQNKEAIELEGILLEGYLGTVCVDPSFTETRKRMRRDLELTGNGYFEAVRTIEKKLLELNHVQSYRMGLTKLDDTVTPYQVAVMRPDKGYAIEQVTKRKRFRRFVQLDSSGSPTVYFKEFGDPRTIDKTTGEVVTAGSIPIVSEATEIIHFKIYSARSVYGIPRYIGRYVSIIGSRRSEEVNFFTLSNNHVPSMFMMCENGNFTDGTVARVTELIESQVSSDPNYAKIIIIEAESNEDERFAGQVTSAKIKIKELKNAQISDELFQKYDGNNQDKVRQSFRLPPLLVGRAQDYTRATARESVRVGDEQVFAPEREPVDNKMNRLMLDEGFRWHIFKSRTPNITDNEILYKAMAVAEKSGGMTPRRADTLMQDIFEGDLGPMPEGIGLDEPFTIQFAQAQNAQRPPGGSPQPIERSGQDWVDSLIHSWMRETDD